MAEQYGTWETESHSLKVRYELAAMESIRMAAMEGLQKIPRRGLEVGGVLFGSHDGNTVTVSQWRAIECEHATGPGFELSSNDEQGLRELLTNAAENPDLRDLEPVGWFRSRCRDGVQLEPEDIRLHDRYFPAAWQVVLVLRPFMYEPAKAGFFFRELGGVIRSESSHREFTLENKRPRRLPLGFDPSRSPHGARQRPLAGWLPPETAAGAAREDRQPGSVARPAPLFQDGDRPAGGKRLKTVKTAAAVIVVLLAVFIGLPAFHSANTSTGLALDIRDVDGQLVLEWNRTAPAVLEAKTASLRIVDGGRQRRLALTQTELRTGSLTYQRRSGDVQFFLTLVTPTGKPVSENARFVGAPPVKTASAEGASSPDAAQQEADHLRRQIEEETKRQAELEDRIQRLRQAVRKR